MRSVSPGLLNCNAGLADGRGHCGLTQKGTGSGPLLLECRPRRRVRSVRPCLLNLNAGHADGRGHSGLTQKGTGSGPLLLESCRPRRRVRSVSPGLLNCNAGLAHGRVHSGLTQKKGLALGPFNPLLHIQYLEFPDKIYF